MSPLKYKYIILTITVLLLGMSIYYIPQMQANYNLESLFPKEDPTLDDFERYKSYFKSDERILMIAIPNTPTVFDTVFLEKIKNATEAIGELSQIKKAESLPTMKETKVTPLGLTMQQPLLKIDSETLEYDSLRLLEDPRIRDLFISSEGDVLTIFSEVTDSVSESSRDSLISSIYEICDNADFEAYHIGGDTYTEAIYIRLLEAENIKLIPLFILTVVIVLWLLYGSFWKVTVPTASVVLGLVFLFGYAAFIGRDLNLATIMYPTIMMVVGMSDLIHFYTKYQIEVSKGLDKKTAIIHSLKEIRVTLFLTSLTTIIGFLAISQSSSPQVRDFGLDGAVGVLLAFLIAITITPIVLSFLPAPSKNEKNTSPLKPYLHWEKWLKQMYDYSLSNQKIILGITAILLILSAIGISQINTNNYILGSINEGSQLRQSYTFFEERLSGVRSFEWMIEAQGAYKIDDLEVLQALQKLENYIDSLDVVGPIFSPLTFYKSAHQIRKRGGLQNYKLPDTQKEINRYNKWSNRFDVSSYMSDDKKVARLTAKMEDIGRLKVKELNQEIDNWIALNLDNSMLKLTPTGRPILLDRNHELMIGQMGVSLSIAFALISLIMAFLFRSARMVLISLVPNLLPLILVAGAMGFVGVELNGSVSIIFTVAFVIAVDDTIHFLSKFKQEVDKHGKRLIALENTMLQTGKAIVITSIILMSGYFILFFSDFREAWYHGVLICFTLFWAVLADLFLLPLLLSKGLKRE